MFAVVLDETKTLLLADATSVVVNEENGCTKFYDGYGNLIALFKLSEIKGFHQMD